MNHTLRCKCGTLQGNVTHPERANRGICYCRDCQAYAHALGGAEAILDDRGGSDIVATLQQYVTFTQGTEALACMSLTERGLLRWYTTCCKTPIGNTHRDPKVSYVGLLHNCLEHSTASIDDVFGPVRMHVHTQSANGKAPSVPLSSFISSAIRVMGPVLRARLNGSYRRTPFFSQPHFKPIAAARVLSTSERERAGSAAAR